VGTSFFPDDGVDAERLLAEADRRMYSMKNTHHAQAAAAQPAVQIEKKANGASVP
jgi:GGDEF domain-containing protein